MTTWILILQYSMYILYVLAGCLILFGIIALLDVQWWRVIAIRKHERFGVNAYQTHYTVAHTCFGLFWIDVCNNDLKPFTFDTQGKAYEFLAAMREEGRRRLQSQADMKLAKKKKTTTIDKYEMVTSLTPTWCEHLAKTQRNKDAAP